MTVVILRSEVKPIVDLSINQYVLAKVYLLEHEMQGSVTIQAVLLSPLHSKDPLALQREHGHVKK